MPLSTAELQAVQRRTKDARSSAAAVRRAANRQRVGGALVLTATDPAGCQEQVLDRLPRLEAA